MNKEKNVALIFCNTAWFALNFKFEVCQKLLEKFDEVKVIYLRKGPPLSLKKKSLLINKGCQFLTFREFIIYRFKTFFTRVNNSLLITFTIGPILIGALPFIFNQKKKIVVLEGLGRVFSSKNTIFKILKFFIINIYKFIFYFSYNKVIILNYIDYSYILEENISPLYKLNIIPGTGIDKNIFNVSNLNKYRDSSKEKQNWISYIGRIDKDKGFYRFIAAALYLLKNDALHDHKFVVISPEEDIKKLPDRFVEDLQNSGIFIYPYDSDTLIYYSKIKIIVIPTLYAEGLSRVALEASLLGIPVVGTRNRGIVSIVKNNYSGILLNDSSAYSIAFAIERIISNYDDYVQKSIKHSSLVVKKYGIDISLNALFDIISKN